jgi:parallel beta-helix repeat protein
MNISRYPLCLLTVAAFVSLSRAPAYATEYFICNKPGGGTGTEADPFGRADLPPADDMYSEGKALSALQPGDTLTFLPGTYELRTSNATVFGYIRPARSGTADKPITLRAQPGGRVVLRSVSGTQGVLGTVKIHGWKGLDYIRFHGFIIECRLPFDKKSNPELNGIRLQGKNNEVGWCSFRGQYLPTTNNFDGIRVEHAVGARIHHNEIVGWKGDHWNAVGIKVYTSDNCVFEDNYVHDNHTGIFDKDAAAGNVYRRNYVTGNTALAFLGSNQTAAGRADAQYFVYENVLDGPVNLLTLSRGIEFHDNLLLHPPAVSDHAGYVLYASGGKVYQTKAWNNVSIAKRPKLTGYAIDLTPWSTAAPKNPLEYCDHNVYDGTPDYRFGRWGGKPQEIFNLEQMRSLGFEKDAKVVSSMHEVYEDEKGYKLKPQWLTAGRNQDPVGPDDVATILDRSRYGPLAMRAPAGAVEPAVK